MVIRKAFKFRLKTNRETEQYLSRSAGCCRFVWNKALALQKEKLEAGERCLPYSQLAELLRDWKQEETMSFLQEVHSQPLQQTLMNLDKAIREAFDPKNPKQFPRFKKKGRHESFRYPQGFKLEDDRVFLPKLGWVRFHKSREIEGTPKNVTVSQRGKHWFVSVQVEMEVSEPVHPSMSTIGIDVGVKRFATLSDGTFIEPRSSFRKLEKKLAREQRKLSRKEKFSKNWHKQRERVSQIHVKIADARSDFLHKASTIISKKHAVVVLEDLRVSNMSKSAKGTKEEPGRNVRAKSGLNKAILDQGWSEFRRQLEYKEAWAGGKVVAVPPRNTSRTCPVCVHVSPENRKTQASFVCVVCGYRENADYVAAMNILAVGHTVSACGEVALAASMKQESLCL